MTARRVDTMSFGKPMGSARIAAVPPPPPGEMIPSIRSAAARAMSVTHSLRSRRAKMAAVSGALSAARTSVREMSGVIVGARRLPTSIRRVGGGLRAGGGRR